MPISSPIPSGTRIGSLHLAFCALETLVIGMTLRDGFIRLPSMHGEHFASWFYGAYAVAALSLALVCLFLRRLHPRSALIGLVTATVAMLWLGVDMPVY